MRIATTETRIGEGSLRSTFVFQRYFWLHAITRERLTYDTRFVPPARGDSKYLVVYLLLAGELKVLEPTPLQLTGPVAFVLTGEEYEGARSQRRLQFRTTGTPYQAAELRIREDLVRTPSAGVTCPLNLGDATWKQVERVILGAADAGDRSVHTLVDQLILEGVVQEGVRPNASSLSATVDRVWGGLAPFIRRFYSLPTLQELSKVAGVSTRQIARDVDVFLQAFPSVGSSWRDATRRARIKVAVLALSAPGVSVGEAARVAGYGSGEAMARAFRDASLPPPIDVQAHLRASATLRPLGPQ